jgi:hypothetical protein
MIDREKSRLELRAVDNRVMSLEDIYVLQESPLK